MKLRSIKVYQSVQFRRKEELFFSGEKQGMKGIGLEIEYDAKGGFARIKCDDDEILVFSTNIAYAVPWDAKTSTDLAAEPKLNNVKPKG